MTSDDYVRLRQLLIDAAADVGLFLTEDTGGGWTVQHCAPGSTPLHLPTAVAVAELLEERGMAMVAAETLAAIEAAKASARRVAP